MPPEASSRPEIGLNFIDTSTSVYGPGGATMTLNWFLIARWTSTFLPLGAPAISSTAHCPSIVVQPSMPFPSKSNRSVGTLSGTLSSSAAAAAGNRGHGTLAASAANVVWSIPRRVTCTGVRSPLFATSPKSLLGQHHQGALHVGRVLGTGDWVEARLGGRERHAGDFPASDGERVHNARDRRRMNVAVDPDDLECHRLPLAHHDGPGRPLVGDDLPSPIRVRRRLSVPFSRRQ